MASFIAAGTAYATHGINMIPFFIYYSMFGPQRIGDLMWAAGDMRCKRFSPWRHWPGELLLTVKGFNIRTGTVIYFYTPLPILLLTILLMLMNLSVIIRDVLEEC